MYVIKEEATAILWSMLAVKDEVHTILLEWQQLALKMARCPGEQCGTQLSDEWHISNKGMDVNHDCGVEVPCCCGRSKRGGLSCFFLIAGVLVCMQEDLRWLMRYGSSLAIINEAVGLLQHQQGGVGNASDFSTR
jgi:hypothetical protein